VRTTSNETLNHRSARALAAAGQSQTACRMISGGNLWRP
jgi:hypothetical protein